MTLMAVSVPAQRVVCNDVRRILIIGCVQRVFRVACRFQRASGA